ncbi:MAG: hypothetical protein ACRECR_02710 [Thermoplasmata archaeon]
MEEQILLKVTGGARPKFKVNPAATELLLLADFCAALEIAQLARPAQRDATALRQMVNQHSLTPLAANRITSLAGPHQSLVDTPYPGTRTIVSIPAQRPAMAPESKAPQALLERWGIVTLEEGLRLWTRPELVYVGIDSGEPKKQQIRINISVVVEAEERFQGDPSPAMDVSSMEPVRTYDRLLVESQPESYYLMPNGALLVMKLRPQIARRFDIFSATRDPLIQIEQGNEVSVLAMPDGPKLDRIEVSGQRGPKSLQRSRK